ncbi:MAG: aminoglycoside phosphotransferase [Gammaproteobacteria bacterium CG_4_10_14_0_8_um_filter_38_16]|nr:MAG: aminoglycoside phosphotransferase [Gammaproteobacteria bacterium CG_4_10_14_0_8_um_filter_38_16]PJA03161.1 MAG: aminoglycoside phosphotransferase [Gammaproteobacteria bacterium CG_4_10_14_0_2_um_filter_38_22]PJB10544.1 MAG: aminoglycoside phosphotransferase [Gammaproteobacteria bacterium CG_4_9_14_3_um_filter_38_9]
MSLLNIVIDTDQRRLALQKWISTFLPHSPISIAPLAGDASFRRYFRVNYGDKSFVAMDAPPEKEDLTAFVAIAKAFQGSDVRLPYIFSADLNNGFLLLSDFGDQQILTALRPDTVDALYHSAMDVLIKMQSCSDISGYCLPAFDADLFWREFDLFFTWYLQKNLGINLSAQDESELRRIYQLLIDSANEQPFVFVHRDYHSRNLMLCSDGQIGVLDFQDAVRGPITYDLVSLLRDCYIAWPDNQVEAWMSVFYAKLHRENRLALITFEKFSRWVDWMGLQRHLKCVGIFSRLCYRDQKTSYLNEIPRVLNYILRICNRYPELSGLKKILS